MRDDEIEIPVNIDNSDSELNTIVLEPWGEEVPIEKGQKATVTFSGPKTLPDSQRIKKPQVWIDVKDGRITLSGWWNTTARVEVDGQYVDTASAAISCF